jgi:outer membrane protein
MKKLYPLFLTIFLSFQLTAQQVDSTLTVQKVQTTDSTFNLSLKQAVEYALTNQKNVINSTLDVEIAQKKVNETIGYGLPQISGSFDVKDYEKIPTQFIPDFISPSVYNILYDENLIPAKKEASNQLYPVQFGAKWNGTAGLTASQLLFDPSYVVGVQASKTYREMYQRNLTRTRIETAVDVTKAYYNVLVVREGRDVLIANRDRLEKLLSDTRIMYENGFVEKIDVDRIQVAHNNAITEVDNFDRQMEISMMNLKFQMGLPQSSALNTTDSLDKAQIMQIQVNSDKADATKRIEYQILKNQQLLQEQNIKRFKGQYLPNIYAYGSLYTTAQRNEFDLFKSTTPWYPTGIIGATLSLNLFDGGQRESKINQEKLALRKIDNELIDFNNSVEIDVQSNRSNLLYALSSLKVQDDNLNLATTISQTTKKKYEQGVGSNIEVLDAESSLKEAQVNYYRALYVAVVAKVDLDKSLGNLNY